MTFTFDFLEKSKQKKLRKIIFLLLGITLVLFPESFVFILFSSLFFSKYFIYTTPTILFAAVLNQQGFTNLILIILFAFFLNKKYLWNIYLLRQGIVLGIFFFSFYSVKDQLFPSWQFKEVRLTSLPFAQESFESVNSVDSWIAKEFTFSSTNAEFYVKMKSNLLKYIYIIVLDEEKKILTTKKCLLEMKWNECIITAKVKKNKKNVLIIGGNGSWNINKSTLDLTEFKITKGNEFLFYEKIIFQSRSSGFSFSENAFGALIAVMGLIITVITTRLKLISVTSTLFCIFLSGSRGALIAFVIGLFVFFIGRSRIYKVLLIVPILTIFCLVVFQFAITPRILPIFLISQTETGFRTLNLIDKDSTRGRLELWRLATKAWLENPRTFLFGTGDLTSAMKVKFDARSSQVGLLKDDLTHAHNLWIQMAGESGLFGLSAMLWLWGWVVLKAWRSRDAGAMALLAAIFVINSVDYLFFYAPVHLAFWMAAAGFKPQPQPKLLEGEKPTLLT